MSLRPELLAAPPYHFSARPEPIKLDQNESPHDLPEPLKDAALQRLAKVAFNRYPELIAQSLRRKLAARHAWPDEGVVVGGGSNVLIQALTIAAGIGRTVLTLKPTFSVYAQQARVLGARLVEVPLGPDFALPVSALERELAQGEGVLFLANPAAPTGNLHARADLERLARASEDRWLFVIDEAYQEFGGEDFADLIGPYPQVVSVRTLSKATGLAGVRLGYALARPDIASELQKALLPFSVSALQLAVAEVVLEHDALVRASVEAALSERARLGAALESLDGVTPYPSDTNFILFRVGDAKAIYEALLARGIVIRRQDHLYGLEGCLRVSVGTPEETSAFIAAMQEVFPPRARAREAQVARG